MSKERGPDAILDCPKCGPDVDCWEVKDSSKGMKSNASYKFWRGHLIPMKRRSDKGLKREPSRKPGVRGYVL